MVADQMCCGFGTKSNLLSSSSYCDDNFDEDMICDDNPPYEDDEEMYANIKRDEDYLCNPIIDENEEDEENLNTVITSPNVKYIMIRPRQCPICNDTLTNSPQGKTMKCYRCGYKPFNLKETVSATKYDENITANDILKEWENEMKNFDEQHEDENKEETSNKWQDRCKCTNESSKPCAYCRVKANIGKLCEKSLSKVKHETFTVNPCNLSAKKTTNISCDASKICKEVLKDSEKREFPPAEAALEELRRIYGCDIKNGFEKDMKCKKKHLGKSKLYDKNYKNKRFSSHNCGILSENSCGDAYKKRRKKKSKMHIGHSCYIPSNCPKPSNTRHERCLEHIRVPHNMGWLWTLFSKKVSNNNFKPGYISRNVKELMLHFMKPIDVLPFGTAKPSPHSKICEGQIPEQKPTLNIKRVKGEYIISYQPLKDAKSLKESEDPYLQMNAIKYKISKKPFLVQKHEVKKKLLLKGFTPCKCSEVISDCCCRLYKEKQCVENEVVKICQKACITDMRNYFHYSEPSDSESDLDVDFTPPAGLVKWPLAKKPDLASKSTQYDPSDYQRIDPLQSPFKINDIRKIGIGKNGKNGNGDGKKGIYNVIDDSENVNGNGKGGVKKKEGFDLCTVLPSKPKLKELHPCPRIDPLGPCPCEKQQKTSMFPNQIPNNVGQICVSQPPYVPECAPYIPISEIPFISM